MNGGRTIEQLSAATQVRADRLLEVLEDERRRGHVEVVDGRWRATSALLARHGESLSWITEAKEEL